MSARLDVRRMLVQRGWVETETGLLRNGQVSVGYLGADVFVTGPARRRQGFATTNFPGSVPAPVIVAACNEWANR